jgi:hypothetical protein
MTKEQLDVAMAMLDAHAEERRRQHNEISDKLDLVIKNTRRELYVWIFIVSVFSAITVETVLSLVL